MAHQITVVFHVEDSEGFEQQFEQIRERFSIKRDKNWSWWVTGISNSDDMSRLDLLQSAILDGADRDQLVKILSQQDVGALFKPCTESSRS